MKPRSSLDRREFVKLSALAATAAILPDSAGAVEMQVAVKARGPITLPELPFAYDALEPHIGAETMRIHHEKHHAEYVAKYNAALALLPEREKFYRDLSDISDESIRNTLRVNGGGHWNHVFFWKTLAPVEKTGPPSDQFAKAIDTSFGSMDHFKQFFTEAALKCFGSGWVWLVLRGKELKITTTANEDDAHDLQVPILALDVWEHAYYLGCQNRRADYISSWWNVVNWERVSKNHDNEINFR
ncbi:MAG: superoxide dismutase [Luteolibacter sp.]